MLKLLLKNSPKHHPKDAKIGLAGPYCLTVAMKV